MATRLDVLDSFKAAPRFEPAQRAAKLAVGIVVVQVVIVVILLEGTG